MKIGDTVKIISGDYAGVIGKLIGKSLLVSGKVVVRSIDTGVNINVWPNQIMEIKEDDK